MEWLWRMRCLSRAVARFPLSLSLFPSISLFLSFFFISISPATFLKGDSKQKVREVRRKRLNQAECVPEWERGWGKRNEREREKEREHRGIENRATATGVTSISICMSTWRRRHACVCVRAGFHTLTCLSIDTRSSRAPRVTCCLCLPLLEAPAVWRRRRRRRTLARLRYDVTPLQATKEGERKKKGEIRSKKNGQIRRKREKK